MSVQKAHLLNILRAAFEVHSKVPSAGLSELLSHVRSASFAFKTSPFFFFSFFLGAMIEIKRCTSLDDRLIYGASAALMAALTPVVADHHGGFVIAHSFTAPLNSEASELVEKKGDSGATTPFILQSQSKKQCRKLNYYYYDSVN